MVNGRPNDITLTTKDLTVQKISEDLFLLLTPSNDPIQLTCSNQTKILADPESVSIMRYLIPNQETQRQGTNLVFVQIFEGPENIKLGKIKTV